MAIIKYRSDASSPWQKIWVRITNYASEIFTSRGKTVEQELDEFKADMLSETIVSDAWNSTTTYAVGDYCIDSNMLYKCLIQHSGMKPSEHPTYWMQINITEEFGIFLYFSSNEGFAWEQANKRFRKSVTLPAGYAVDNISCYATNCAAVCGALYSNGYLNMFGFIPSTGESIGNAYILNCVIKLRKI